MKWAIPFLIIGGLWVRASVPPPPPDPPPAGAPSYVPRGTASNRVAATWIKYESKTNIVLMAKDTFKVSWPMQTCTNLTEGAWTNEKVPILIGIETNVPQKFFKPREAGE